MRKHFLLLFLLTLLPLVGWAANVVVTPYNTSKYYGQPDNAAAKLFDVNQQLTDEQLGELTAMLTVYRNGENASEELGDYTYTLKAPANAEVGGYTVVVQGSALFSIEAMPLSNEGIVAAPIPNQSKTGSAIEPVVSLTNNGEPIPASEFEVTWENNTNGPTATGTITPLTANYTGSKQVTFAIKQGIEDAVITLTGVNNLAYTGVSQHPATVTVTLGGEALTLTNEYTLSYEDEKGQDAINAGIVTLTVTGAGEYAGTKTTTYQIAPKAVAAANITWTLGDAPAYTGNPVAPVFNGAVKENNNNLAESDYEITNASTNAGAATATLTLVGNYSGSKTVNYTIAQKAFSGLTLVVDPNASLVYNNVDIKPAVTVKNGEATVDASNYTIVYKDNDNTNDNEGFTAEDLKTVGTKHIVVTGTGTGNYDNTAITTYDYAITARPLTITAQDLTVGIGADINPEATIDNYAQGHSLADLSASGNGKVTFTYQQGGNNVANPTGVGEYTIIPSAAEFDNTNYTYTNLVNGTLAITAGQVTAQVKDQTVTFGTAFAAGSIVHNFGLAPAQVEDFNTNVNTGDITGYTVYEQDGVTVASKFIENNVEQNFYPAGTYVVKANGAASYAGYDVSLIAGTWTVEKKAIDGVTISALTRAYTGNATAVPATEGKLTWAGTTLVENTDYTVAVKVDANDANLDNKNVSAGEKKGKVTISAVNGGNYSGSVVREFTITKATLTITANDYVDGDADTQHNAWAYGTTEPTYTATVEGLVGDDEGADLTATTAPAGFTGRLVVTRTSNATVGMHADALVASGVTNPNYTIVTNTGDLEIVTGTVTVKVKDVTIKYGEVPSFTLEYVSGLAEEEVPNFVDIVNFSTTAADYGYVAAEMKDVNTTGYALTYNGVDPTATNYNVVFQNADKTGKLIIEKRPVKFTAKDKADLAYSAKDAWIAGLEVTNTYIEQTVDENFLALLAGDVMSDLIASIQPVTTKVGDNVLSLTAMTEGKIDNYEVTLIPGKLTITAVGVQNLVLKRVAKADFATAANDAAQKIAELDGQAVNVTFTFPGQTMWNNKWYSMVLPFNTTVREISKAFGYAVVDIFDKDNSRGDDVSFKLWMGEIKANEPFIIKVDQDITAAVFETVGDAQPKFSTVEIDNTTNPSVTVADKYGNQFIGTYTGIDGSINSLNTATDYIFGLGKTAQNYQPGSTQFIRPLGAYIKFKDSQTSTGAPHMIYIEEPDGTTTAISAIANDSNIAGEGWYNLNGVKLQNAPIEKGVYIQNGKKVVIK